MEIIALTNKKNELKIELKNESHAISNALTKELWEDKTVISAGYMLESTMEENPILTVVTKGKTPKKAIQDAIKRLTKKFDEFQTKFKKIK